MNRKILIVHPLMGGIDVYVARLSEWLKRIGWDVTCFNTSERSWPYDRQARRFKELSEVMLSVEHDISMVDWQEYDFVLFNFGKNDVEQVIPVLLDRSGRKPARSCYISHYLSWQLFQTFVVSEPIFNEIQSQMGSFFQSYVWFGENCRQHMCERAGRDLSGIVSLLPETHPEGRAASTGLLKRVQELKDSSDLPFVTLPGYAANYKDSEFLFESLAELAEGINLLIIGSGWSRRISGDSFLVGTSRVSVIDSPMTPEEYKEICRLSQIGIFPYRQPSGSDEVFQGSGTLPNFIALEKPCVVLNQGSLPEYFRTPELVCKSSSPAEFARMIRQALAISRSDESLARYKVTLRDVRMENHAHEISTHLSAMLNN